jgi:acetyl-CoA carboxylase carboxyltransferase component
MDVLASHISTSSADFKANSAHHRDLSGRLKERLQEVAAGGSAQAVAKQRERGKMLPRERIDQLLDPQTPFLELSALAAWDLYKGDVPSAGVVTGIGRICGRECVIVANDSTVKGGTYFPETIKKHIRAQAIALENRLPAIYLVDSGGVFLPMQDEVFPDKEHFGNIFYNQAVMSSLALPQVSVVLGMCTAGGAYVPAMSDENVIVKGKGTIYLAGPPLVKAATGEEVTTEDLGGGEMHSRVSGVTDHLAQTEEDALQICRNIVENLNSPQRPAVDVTEPEDPLYDPSELYGVLPTDGKHPYVVTRFARLMGFPIGIVANNGVLFSESAIKGAHFVTMCAQRKTPLIFLQNITGFMVGKRYEQGGICKDGAKMVQAVATAAVPKITVIIGASHGAGNYAMCGRGYLPRFLFTWPNARVSVMGAEQAASVLVQVKREQLARQNKTLTDEEVHKIEDPVREKYEREGDPYYGTARLWDDGIIDPAQTRAVVGLALSASLNTPIPESKTPVFRM